jgi:hypothetical protein
MKYNLICIYETFLKPSLYLNILTLYFAVEQFDICIVIFFAKIDVCPK